MNFPSSEMKAKDMQPPTAPQTREEEGQWPPLGLRKEAGYDR